MVNIKEREGVLLFIKGFQQDSNAVTIWETRLPILNLWPCCRSHLALSESSGQGELWPLRCYSLSVYKTLLVAPWAPPRACRSQAFIGRLWPATAHLPFSLEIPGWKKWSPQSQQGKTRSRQDRNGAGRQEYHFQVLLCLNIYLARVQVTLLKTRLYFIVNTVATFNLCSTALFSGNSLDVNVSGWDPTWGWRRWVVQSCAPSVYLTTCDTWHMDL